MLLRSWASVLSIALLCAIPSVSRADTVYDVNGTFENVGGPALGGTYTISDAGVVTAADLTVDGTNFTSVSSSTGPNSTIDFTLASLHGVNPNDYISLAISDTDFGKICSTANKPSCLININGIPNGLFTFANVSGAQLNLISGSAIAEPATATPEPSSLALLGTGLLGLAGVARRKFGRV